MDIKNLLTRSRNLLSHPPLWWKENEASRERLIGELDAAIHQPVSVEPVAIALHTGTKQGIKWLARVVEHGTNLYTAYQMHAYCAKGIAAMAQAGAEPVACVEPVGDGITEAFLLTPLLAGTMLYAAPLPAREPSEDFGAPNGLY